MTLQHRIVPFLLLAFLLPGALTDPAQAAWSSDPMVNVPVCTAANTQQYPRSCPDGAGGAIIVWVDYRSDGSGDVYAQRLDRDGVSLWTANGVAVCTATGGQYAPSICPDGSGGAIIAWVDARGSSADIYVQRVWSNGVPGWTANGVALCTASYHQNGPEICTDGAGGAIVTWYDNRSNVSNDIYARRVNSSGTPQWTANGVALCTATNNQSLPQIVPDGSGGAIAAWTDDRSGTSDVYAQRVNTSGTIQWTANGIVICNSASTQSGVALASDGSGGAIVAWHDFRNATDYNLYAQRVNASGTAQWMGNGMAVCTSADDQELPAIASDGAGGAIIAWQDFRNGSDNNVYAQRLKADGFPQWTANGVALCSASGHQLSIRLAGDGAGGAIVAWLDYRNVGAYLYARRVSSTGNLMWTSNGVPLCTNGTSDQGHWVTPDDVGGAIVAFSSTHGLNDFNIYAQRVDRFGAIGEAEPAITAIEDVAGDQGGQVVVEWTASYLDADPVFGIEAYSVWRQVPSAAVTAEPATLAAAAGGLRPALRAATLGAQTTYWEYVGSVPARAREGYSFVTATTTDSMAGSNPCTRFMVSAENGGSYYWDSAPDSGYSVDNLAPPTPSPFAGAYADGASALQWGVCPAADFAVFRLYRGHSADFVPDAGNLLATLTTCSYTDDLGYPAWYKLCAVDIHGNVSPYAGLLPNGSVDVPGPALPHELALSAPAPNPLRGATALRLALPRSAAVAAAVYDQQGRVVRTLLAGPQPAGEHTLRWDGRDEAGRAVPSGMYFVRCTVDGRVLTRRIAALR
jgi:transposase